ncbi:MAG: class I SAM-dependent methyltransferase [Candidatus Eutrophobiaceae bacterium]
MLQNSYQLLASFIALLVACVAIPAVAADDTSAFTDEQWRVALEGGHRDQDQRNRDQYRHPRETLLFFGLQPETKALEITPGSGWYTKILAPLLDAHGQLTVASFGTEVQREYYRKVHRAYMEMLDSQPNIYGKVVRTVFQGDEGVLVDVEDASQDMVVTFRNVHHWVYRGGFKEIFQACYRVLKPGGILGVVQHRAPEGSDAVEWAKKGYVTEKYLIQNLEDMGFELVEKSEINANPADSKDHPEGVWTLPPGLRLKDKDRAKYLAIGESDRMTLKFVKVR